MTDMEKRVDEDYVCEDYGDVKQWTQIKVTVPLSELDEVEIPKLYGGESSWETLICVAPAIRK